MLFLIMHTAVADPRGVGELSPDEVLVFMKFFDWRTHKLRSLGTMYVNKMAPIGNMVQQVMRAVHLTAADLEGREPVVYEVRVRQTTS